MGTCRAAVLGLLLMAGAARQWSKYRKADEAPELPGWMASLDGFSPAQAFGLGAISAAVNPKILALTFSAAVTIGQAGLSGAEQATVLIVFVAISSVTVISPVGYYFLAKESAADTLGSLRDWLTVHQAAIVAGLFLVIGAVVLGQGLAGIRA